MLCHAPSAAARSAPQTWRSRCLSVASGRVLLAPLAVVVAAVAMVVAALGWRAPGAAGGHVGLRCHGGPPLRLSAGRCQARSHCSELYLRHPVAAGAQ